LRTENEKLLRTKSFTINRETMKSTFKQSLLATALACALASTSTFAQIPTTGTLKSPIGPLEVKNG